MKKITIILLNLIALLTFTTKSILAHDVPLEVNTLESSSINEELNARSPLRPSKIWISDSRFEYSGRTLFYETSSYGAIYKGTLDLKPGTYFGGFGTYRGYVYNAGNGYYPLKENREQTEK